MAGPGKSTLGYNKVKLLMHAPPTDPRTMPVIRMKAQRQTKVTRVHQRRDALKYERTSRDRSSGKKKCAIKK